MNEIGTNNFNSLYFYEVKIYWSFLQAQVVPYPGHALLGSAELYFL